MGGEGGLCGCLVSPSLALQVLWPSNPCTMPSCSMQYFSYLSISSSCICQYSPLGLLLRCLFRLSFLILILEFPLTSFSFSSSNSFRSPSRNLPVLLPRVSVCLCPCAALLLGVSSPSPSVSVVYGSSSLSSPELWCVAWTGALAQSVEAVPAPRL